ncbi:MAG: class I SAM-dependent methyltransferase [Pirellulales bacterium]|nr:class I SAM-dependent methyltransferase [Pirellulales bacterium]
MTKSDKEKWDRKYAKQDLYQEVSQVVLAYQHWIPAEGKALDVAGGTGRHAIWLAQRGLDVSLVDVSSEALRQAAIRASEAGVELTTFCRDLDGGLPEGKWDFIFTNLFFDRRLFSYFREALAPGGRLMVIQPTQTNATRHQKPPGKFLPGDDELPGLAAGLEILLYETGWLQEGRFDAVLVAKSPFEGS